MESVSILLPVYNNQDDIIVAIQSVIDQTYTHWQLIIIDDCSIDKTNEVVQSFIANLNNKYNIVFITNEHNVGVYVSLNKGLSLATGNYICRIDSDDKIIKNYFELNINILKSYPDLIATRSFYQRYKGDQFENPIEGEITLFYKKKVIEDIGYYDNVRLGADSEFLARIEKKYGRDKINIFRIVTYYAQLRENSLTTSVITGNIQIRLDYVARYTHWHNNTNLLYIPFPLINRPFIVDDRMV